MTISPPSYLRQPPGQGSNSNLLHCASPSTHWLALEIYPSASSLHLSFIKISSSSFLLITLDPFTLIPPTPVSNPLHLHRHSSPPHWFEAYSRERKREGIIVCCSNRLPISTSAKPPRFVLPLLNGIDSFVVHFARHHTARASCFRSRVKPPVRHNSRL